MRIKNITQRQNNENAETSETHEISDFKSTISQAGGENSGTNNTETPAGDRYRATPFSLFRLRESGNLLIRYETYYYEENNRKQRNCYM